ncbi:uncharacterized protein LOC120711736 isoform X4 [Panicum virgatum]|uniref:uncharacterized protein LOC120711736 isoform X4 n=1 Tax=Panicum virgatum TaxID=38727 RepID=UPI0019D61849|nr:uncharacterized protein LOC120711736 isoform X4 [Panicum virgatum]
MRNCSMYVLHLKVLSLWRCVRFWNQAVSVLACCRRASSQRDCRRHRLGYNKFGEEEKMECWTSNLLKIEFDTKGQQIDSCGTLVAGVVLSSHLLIRDAVNFL